MNSIVTIIVPVYNSSAYLRECLESVRRQTSKDWTCVLVNDGSTDNSQSIIDEYCTLDGRFVGVSKPNERSVAKARYYGLKFAMTDFVILLDSDDILGDDDYVEKLTKRQRETNADVVISRMCCFEIDTSNIVWILPDDQFDCSQVIDGKTACLLTIPSWKIGLNGNMSRKELYNSLSEGNWANIDEVHGREMLIKSKRVAFSDSRYYYRRNPSSITRAISPYMFDRTINDFFLVKIAQKHFPDNKVLINELARIHVLQLRNYIVKFEEIKDKLSEKERVRMEMVLSQSYQSVDVGLLFKKMKSLKWGIVVALLRKFSWFRRFVVFCFCK